MSIKELNIISFDVPFPANYGGVIDVFYKIKALHKIGIKIHLHCFEYGRGKQAELEKYCETINYYPRKTGVLSFLSLTPYIVQSRVSNILKNNLLKNNFPILFEGLHTCFLLSDSVFTNRIKIVRAHNIEHEYYHHLAKSTAHFFKKLYFFTEAFKLKRYEPIVNFADLILAVTENDETYFNTHYSTTKVILTPCFHAQNTIKIKPGKGNYVLYHGNLAVQENEDASLFICNKIFNNLAISLIIAGLNPSKKLKNVVSKYTNIELVENPTAEKMNELIANAQINLLLTNQPTGLKLKLLNALFNGRFCLVNDAMLSGVRLNESIYKANLPEEFKTQVQHLFNQEIDVEKEMAIRNSELVAYQTDFNGRKLVDALDVFPKTSM